MGKIMEKIPKSDLMHLLIDHSPVAYIILDNHYRIHYINDNFFRLQKQKPGMTAGAFAYNFSNPGVLGQPCAVEQVIKTGRKSMISRRDTLPDGTVQFIDDYAMPLYHDALNDTQFILEIMVNRTEEMLVRERQGNSYNEVLSTLISLIEAKDPYTATHSANVRKYAVKIAQALELSEKEIFEISIAANIHDIGKIHIPNSIINKNTRLTEEELRRIKTHPEISYAMLQGLSSFESIKNIVRYHHERFDGRGYPHQIQGTDIPLGARIIAVADTFKAITSTRSYRPAATRKFALEEIERVAGTQLDPDIAKVFLSLDWDKNFELPSLENEEKRAVPPIPVQTSVESTLHPPNTKSTPKKFLPDQDPGIIDQDPILSAILDNSPCGYVLMNTEREVLLANKYFLEFMGLSEAEILGKIHGKTQSPNSKPFAPYAIAPTQESDQVVCQRVQQNTKNGLKIFDMFRILLPGLEGNTEYALETIIDRTEETHIEQQREHDFHCLIAMLTSLLEKQNSENDDADISQEILRLHERVQTLIQQ